MRGGAAMDAPFVVGIVVVVVAWFICIATPGVAG